MCDWGLSRRLFGRGAALREASEFLAPGAKHASKACSWDSVCCYSLVKLPPPARFRAHPRGSEAFLRVSITRLVGLYF